MEETYRQNVLLKVSYDGSNFNGWQKQKKDGVALGGTVQEALEKALEGLHGFAINTVAAGRTDSGVHAREQGVNFFTNIKSIKEKQFPFAINSFLPYSIRVMSSHFVKDDFSARFNALSRTYRYFIFCGQKIYPHQIPYCHHIRKMPSINKLNRLASVLYGENDFSVFASSKDASISKSRYIKNAIFFIEGDYLVFEICATSFLWRMVRSIVGTILEYEKKGFDENDLKTAIIKKNRKLVGATAPSKGLFLWSVEYPQDIYLR
ncbi:MAG: tRNA pseudouridine(38-40) synthase TruA [Treponema sp.]